MKTARATAAILAFAGGLAAAAEPADTPTGDWLARWEENIIGDMRNRYCDRETGEELGWLVSPFLGGFHYGYMATKDTTWIDRLVDWADAVVKRGVEEPDGYVGWPKAGGASTKAVPDFYTDNELGEAMMLRPLVLMATEILRDPALKARYGLKAQEYLRLSERTFEKWDSRCAWRRIEGGGLWVVPPFGIDPATGGWTEGYERRKTDGFSLPANKQNLVACWLLAMHDATRKPVYRERAGDWFRVMKSRMRLREDGKFLVWNYWDPAGPWDFKPYNSPKHWVGVHPNGGYYAADLEGIVLAYEHDLVFTKADIDRLIATNRDAMWDGRIQGAKFRRIDGGEPDKRWAASPGVLWAALAPYDPKLRGIFEANHDPASWGGLCGTPKWIFTTGAASRNREP